VKIIVAIVEKIKLMYWRYILLVKKSNRLSINELSLDSKGELINKSAKLDSLVQSKSWLATWLRNFWILFLSSLNSKILKLQVV